jgi:HEAT repeat protein
MKPRMHTDRHGCGGIIAALFVVMSAHPWFAPTAIAAEFDAKALSLDELLPHAVRYGDTVERREAKEQARQEIFARRPASFRHIMSLVHLDNVGIQVMAHEMVDQMTADDAVPVLLDFVTSEHEDTRRAAAYFLGFYPTAATNAAAIRPLLLDERTRNAAIRTLGKWRSAGDMRAVAGFLTDTKERTRVTAANALRDIGDARAVPALIAALNDPYFTVRNTAQRAIVSFNKRAEEELLGALPLAKPPAQRLIVQALGQIRSDKAYRALKDLSQRGDPLVRADAREALKNIKTPLVDRIF